MDVTYYILSLKKRGANRHDFIIITQRLNMISGRGGSEIIQILNDMRQGLNRLTNPSRLRVLLEEYDIVHQNVAEDQSFDDLCQIIIDDLTVNVPELLI